MEQSNSQPQPDLTNQTVHVDSLPEQVPGLGDQKQKRVRLTLLIRVLIGVLIMLIVLVAVGLLWQFFLFGRVNKIQGEKYNQILNQQEPVSNDEPLLLITLVPTAPESTIIPLLDTKDWEVYTNREYDFSLKYPSDLSVVARVADLDEEWRLYREKCELEWGCGGPEWPTVRIDFVRQNDKVAFYVSLYPKEVIENFSGLVVHGEYAYGVGPYLGQNQADPGETVSVGVLKTIGSTLNFPD